MSQIRQNTKLWSIAEFDRLDVFRAEALHYHYARHSHSGYAIGLIEAGVGGNYYRGATYLAPPQSIVLMNPEEAHTGYSAEGLPLTYRMLYPSVQLVEQIAGELESDSLPYFKIPVVKDQALVKALLRQGMTLAETAIAVGMADQSHLNRHFKRIVGITPGQYRQSHVQQE